MKKRYIIIIVVLTAVILIAALSCLVLFWETDRIHQIAVQFNLI